MVEPYYTGDNVPLAFTVDDKDGEIQPTAVKVIIFKGKTKTAEDEADADIQAESPYTISYLVPTDVTTEDGEYHAFFICELPSGIRTYQMNFNVLNNPR